MATAAEPLWRACTMAAILTYTSARSHTEAARELYLLETFTFLPPAAEAAVAPRRVSRPAASAAKMPQCLPLVHSDVIGLVAFNLVLRIVLARMMDVTFVVHVTRMHLHDTAADPAGLGIPGDVIADFECLRHNPMLLSNPGRRHTTRAGTRAIRNDSGSTAIWTAGNSLSAAFFPWYFWRFAATNSLARTRPLADLPGSIQASNEPGRRRGQLNVPLAISRLYSTLPGSFQESPVQK